jgi:hypothetical protein
VRRISLLVTVCGLALSLGCSDRLASMQDLVKGTWALQSRRLPDGKVLSPPHIFGLMQWSPIDSRTAHVTLDVLLRPEGGEGVFDHSASTCEISTSAITRKRHMLIRRGYKSSSQDPIVYYNKERSFKGKVSVEGDQFTISHEEGQTQVFKGDAMTTTISGGFVDTWKRIR